MKDWDRHGNVKCTEIVKVLSLLRQDRSLLRSEFCTEGDVVLQLVLSGILSFRRSLNLICPLLSVAPTLSAIFSFSNVQYMKVSTQD